MRFWVTHGAGENGMYSVGHISPKHVTALLAPRRPVWAKGTLPVSHLA